MTVRSWQTTSSAPSSIFLAADLSRASATRSEKTARSPRHPVRPARSAPRSGCPWARLKNCARSGSVLRPSPTAERGRVRSTTRPTSGGTRDGRPEPEPGLGKTPGPATAQAEMASGQPSSRSNLAIGYFDGAAGVRVEIDLRRDGDFLLIHDREVRLLLVAEHHRRQIVRKGADADVIILHRLDCSGLREKP